MVLCAIVLSARKNMNPIKSLSTQIMELRSKKLDIELDINKALSAKEIAQKDAEQALENVEAIRKDIRELSDVLSSILSSSSSLGDVCKLIATEYLETIRDASSVMKDYSSMILDLRNEIVLAENELESVKKEQESVLENIKNENARLAVMKDDLDIYKKRLETIRDEVAPSMSVLV